MKLDSSSLIAGMISGREDRFIIGFNVVRKLESFSWQSLLFVVFYILGGGKNMILTKLKAKNQITLPQEIIGRFNFRKNEFLYLEAIDKMVEREKHKAKTIKSGKEFAKYITTRTK